MAHFELSGGVYQEVKRPWAARGGVLLLSALALTGCGTQNFESAAQERPTVVTVTVEPNNEAPVVETPAATVTTETTKTKSPAFIEKNSRPADCYLLDPAKVMCSPEKSGVYYMNGTDENTADDMVDATAGRSFTLQLRGAITANCGNITVAYAKNEDVDAHPFFQENVCSNGETSY